MGISWVDNSLMNTMFFTCVFTIVSVIFGIMLLNRIVHKRSDDIEDKLEDMEKWLFDSLYSINPNVKLPDEKTKENKEPAKVYSPKNDPWSEFKGELDDYID